MKSFVRLLAFLASLALPLFVWAASMPFDQAAFDKAVAAGESKFSIAGAHDLPVRDAARLRNAAMHGGEALSGVLHSLRKNSPRPATEGR